MNEPAKTPFLDDRSLALFRMAVGLLLIFDLAFRALDLTVFHGDAGYLPRGAALSGSYDWWHFSLYYSSGEAFGLAVLFAVSAALAFAYLLGYQTRWAGILSFILLLSLHRRSPLVLQGGDVLLRLLLFWSLFLPIDRRFAVRPALRGSHPQWAEFTPQIVYALQIFCVYFFSAAIKLKFPTWTEEGLGVFYAFNCDILTTAFGQWLGQLMPLVVFANYLTLIGEGLFPFAVLLPAKWQSTRLFLCATFVGFHVGILFTLKVGLFVFIGMAAWLPLLPPLFWEYRWTKRLEAWLDTRFHRAEHARPERPRWRMAGAVTAGLLMPAIFYWNLAVYEPTLPRPPAYASPLKLLGLDQTWDMFSQPILADGYWVIPAVLRNGEKRNLFGGEEPLTYEKPDSVSGSFRGDRWRKFYFNLYSTGDQRVRLNYGRWICRTFNKNRSYHEQLMGFRLVFMRREVDPRAPGGHRPARKEVIWNHVCFDEQQAEWNQRVQEL